KRSCCAVETCPRLTRTPVAGMFRRKNDSRAPGIVGRRVDDEDASLPDRDGAPRPPLLGAARRARAEGSGRLEPRPPPAVDAVGRERAAVARGEGRAPAPLSRPVRPRAGLRARHLLARR